MATSSLLHWHQFSSALADPRHHVQVSRDFLGYQVRPSGWSAPRWRVLNGWHYFILVAQGRIHLHPSDGPEVAPGQALLVAPGEYGPTRFESGTHYHELWLRCQAGTRSIMVHPGMLVICSAESTRWLFQRITSTALMPRGGTLDVIKAGAAMLVACLVQEHAVPDEAPKLSMQQRDRVMQWSAEHLLDRPTPARLAREIGLSHDYFSRLFRATYGVAPHSWLAAARIRLAARTMRETDQPIATIAAACGFHDVSNFGRLFKKVIGMTPREWRRG